MVYITQYLIHILAPVMGVLVLTAPITRFRESRRTRRIAQVLDGVPVNMIHNQPKRRQPPFEGKFTHPWCERLSDSMLQAVGLGALSMYKELRDGEAKFDSANCGWSIAFASCQEARIGNLYFMPRRNTLSATHRLTS